MPQEKKSPQQGTDSQRHAEWVREHPRIEESAFPEYPDEKRRRGSSRGAQPNGNPWGPVDPDEKPGRPAADPSSSSDASRASPTTPSGSRSSGENPVRSVEAPPPKGRPTHRPVVLRASSPSDERIGRDISDVLAAMKALDGRQILVEVNDGNVSLRGAVPDQNTKTEVGISTSSVRGTKRVDNELTVDE